ncbi:39S ribosomal protein L55 mitochondrial [Clonorchis sinensis]|uniref:39S ribosomal protein L55 mitochondrial n=1 Tax=Clonorchis sinensis TaxID=79923 RepID=G7Y6C1_CLOSI|nr:39S ribosomal protein L55 mitochondrial [Clonorchis sinensis]
MVSFTSHVSPSPFLSNFSSFRLFFLVSVNLMQSSLCGRIVRGPLNLITRTNANRAVVTHIKRKTYARTYPVTVALPNGASIRIRYEEPRYLLQVPLDLDECSPEERQRRLLRRTPRARLALQEEIEDTFDRSAYEFLLK